jgi:putative salt-induced outer membrane protein YdiY
VPERPIAHTGLISVLVSLAACLAFPAFARPKTDLLVMKNGDRITCEVKNLDAGVLKVNLDYVDGTIAIDWLKVARLESNFMFLVQLQDGSIYSGKVVNAEALEGAPVKIEIRTEEEESVVVDKSRVVRMTQTSDTFRKRWSGEIDFGWSYAKGNTTTQYNLGSEMDYQQTKWGGRFRLNSNLSSSTGATVATRNQVDLGAHHQLSRTNYFVAGSAGFLQSSVQEIEHQTIFGGSLGRFLKNTNRVRFTVQGGLGWQRTAYASSAESARTQDIGVALISSNLQAFTFKKSRLDVTATVVPAVTELGRLFAKINASYYLKLFGKIDWNLSFYGNWDTQPPAHLPASDYGSSSGLSYSFGNK